jgi:hypothetical protein
MAITNRMLDVTEQRKVFELAIGTAANLVNGFSAPICTVPWPCLLDGGNLVAYGLSGSPQFQISVNRWNGSVAATFVVATGTSNVPAAYGTSGSASLVIAASGSTLLQLQANDVLLYAQTGGASAAATSAVISVILRPLQDVKVNYQNL